MRHAALLCGLLVACSQTLEPCPPGSEALRREDRCIALAEREAPSMPDDDAGPPDSGSDASQPRHDAGLPELDGGSDASTPDAAICSAADVAAWAAFHRQEGAHDLLLACIRQGCDGGQCDAAACIRDAANVSQCEDCAWQEADCVVASCPSACGEPGNDAECRACTCEAGCVARFETCAESELGVCADVYGRDPSSAAELVLEGSWIVRGKSGTGLLQSTPLAPFPPAPEDFSFTTHLSKGFTHLLSFSLGERSYLLQHKSRCGNDPCFARISPLLSDGSLGRPVYLDTWTRGWDELELFTLDGASYLLRYKTGAAPCEGEPAGSVAIDRLDYDERSEQLALVPVFRQSSNQGAPWSSYEAFALSGETYLLRYGSPRGGELQVLRVDAIGEQLVLTPASDVLSWSRGWDIVEGFVHQGRPFVLAYKSGRVPVTGEPAGTLRIVGLSVSSQGVVSVTPAIYDALWQGDLSRIVPYAATNARYLLTQDKKTGLLEAHALPDDASAWQEALGSPSWTDKWGTNPVWDLLEVVQAPVQEPAP